MWTLCDVASEFFTMNCPARAQRDGVGDVDAALLVEHRRALAGSRRLDVDVLDVDDHVRQSTALADHDRVFEDRGGL
jgi:hypothetical protein